MKVNIEILTDYLNGKCDEKTKLEVENWIVQNKKNQKYYDELRFYWQCNRSETINIDFDTNKAYQNLLKKGNIQKRRVLKRIILYAAVVALLISSGFLGYFNWFPQSPKQIVNLQKINQKLELPDSSHIGLAHGSKIEFDKNFNRTNRIVNLNGEAFFQVRKDKSKPFIVNTPYTCTKVLGTSFRIAETKGRTILNVSTGIVEFSSLKNQSIKARLKKGETAHFVEKQSVILKGKTDAKQETYTVNYLEYKNEKLEQICEDLNELFAKDIRLQSKDIDALVVSGLFENQNLYQVLESVAFSLNLTIENNQEYVLLKIP